MSQRTSRAHRSLVLSLLVSATFHRDPGFKCGVRASISGTPKTAQLYGRTRVRYTVEAMTRSDVQMMLDVKAGDEASFDLLLQKYRTPLVNFLYRMVRDSATAEDLAQEVFLRDNRYRRMQVSLDAPAEEDEAPIQVPARDMRIDEHMVERDRAEFIHRAIAALPEKQRVAIL